jgi:hypothetical protein
MEFWSLESGVSITGGWRLLLACINLPEYQESMSALIMNLFSKNLAIHTPRYYRVDKNEVKARNLNSRSPRYSAIQNSLDKSHELDSARRLHHPLYFHTFHTSTIQKQWSILKRPETDISVSNSLSLSTQLGLLPKKQTKSVFSSKLFVILHVLNSEQS